MKVLEDFTITEKPSQKVPSRAFSMLDAPPSTFTCKNLLGHYDYAQ